MQDSTHKCDILVIGSGAGGLSAALTASLLGLDVLLCEQADKFGGASAISGGEVWIPLNRQCGGSAYDSEAEALAYLEGVIGSRLDRELAETYVHNAAKALAFIEDHSEVEYETLPHVVDYFSRVPGAKNGIRTLGALPYDGRRLGQHFEDIRSPLAIGMIFGGMAIGREDLPHVLNMTRSLTSALHVAGMLLRHAWDRLRGYSRGTRMVMGNALVGRLMATLLKRKVPMWLSTSITELTLQGGRVTGAVVCRQGHTQRIACRRAVVLANGSFSGNAEMRAKFFAHVGRGKPHHSHVPASSDGSGITLAVACGGIVDERVRQPGAWTPVSMVPLRDGSTAAFSHFGDRAKPGVIVVNKAGRRFANEALNYHDFLQAMLAECANDDEVEVFVLTSHRHLRKYGLGRVPAFPGRIGPFLRNGYLQRGRTIAELAERVGVDARTLEQTIATFNEHAARGMDPLFHKGETVFEQAAGDPDVSPNACVAPLDDGPWYAIKMIPGDIGTLLGLRVDSSARVLGASGAAIAGLYAVGTVASSMMCGNYPVAGAMLGPALTSGYMAAHDIAAGAATTAATQPAARAATSS